MPTEIHIDANRFYINGRRTYEGISWQNRPIEGLLFNSRMVQAIFDDANPLTRPTWRYPDTGIWDPDRNTDEFCAAIPEYRRHGLLAVTVGLQGGGSVFTPAVYDNYLNSAYEPDGRLKPAYFSRLERILAAADSAGMVVIVNYFYWKQAARLQGESTIRRITEEVTGWLLHSGYRNILVDVANEAAKWWNQPAFRPDNVHRLIELVQGITLGGRRLLAGASSAGGNALPVGRWQEIEDFHMPHGNGLRPDELRTKLRQLKDSEPYQRQPRPVLINEDSIFVDNLEAAIAEYASWGFYCQGYGSNYRDLADWTIHERESNVANLSGYQTVPVNWGINDLAKRAFFERLNAITAGR